MTIPQMLLFASYVHGVDFAMPNHFCVVGVASVLLMHHRGSIHTTNVSGRDKACLAQTGIDCCRGTA